MERLWGEFGDIVERCWRVSGECGESLERGDVGNGVVILWGECGKIV